VGTSENQKVLLLLRHAKSAWDRDVDDRERQLSGRGKRDAVAVGQLLAARDLVPDVVVCSTAARTRETWDRAVKGGARAPEIRYLDQIYAARVTELVRVVRGLPETARTALMVGHAPGVPDLVEFLAARAAGSPAWARMDRKFPTAGLAILTFHGTWAEAGQSRAELTGFEVPRGAAPN
jgi:phosphohistidine phosphatase